MINMLGTLYFNIAGPDTGGWRVTVYEWVECRVPPKPDNLQVAFKSGPHYFDTLQQAKAYINELESLTANPDVV